MNNIRRIKLPNLYNLRDMGGYECSGAGDTSVISWNRLYRCDCPSDLKEDEWNRIRDLKIKTLIDLRSTFEASENPVNAPDDLVYLHRPFFKEEPGVDLTGEAGKKFLESLSIDYCVMAETSAKQIADILNTILDSLTVGNVAFFCTAGKDRTGIVAAQILRMCGVSDEDIIADYSITEVYNEEVIRARIESIPKEILAQVSPETMALAASSKPETMRRYLRWSAEWGFADVMDKNGFTTEKQSRLKAALTDKR